MPARGLADREPAHEDVHIRHRADCHIPAAQFEEWSSTAGGQGRSPAPSQLTRPVESVRAPKRSSPSRSTCASGELRLLQPEDAADIPDDGPVAWAPIAPYWSVLWRSGVALAHELDGQELRGRRVVELGCGLGVPSIAAARAGASVLATDECPEALTLLERNARANDVRLTRPWWSGRSRTS